MFSISCELVSPFVALMSCVGLDPVEGDLEGLVKEKSTDGVYKLLVGFGFPFACNDIDGPLAVGVDFDS